MNVIKICLRFVDCKINNWLVLKLLACVIVRDYKLRIIINFRETLEKDDTNEGKSNDDNCYNPCDDWSWPSFHLGLSHVLPHNVVRQFGNLWIWPSSSNLSDLHLLIPFLATQLAKPDCPSIPWAVVVSIKYQLLSLHASKGYENSYDTLYLSEILLFMCMIIVVVFNKMLSLMFNLFKQLLFFQFKFINFLLAWESALFLTL